MSPYCFRSVANWKVVVDVVVTDMHEVESFDKGKLKKTETKEKNPLPTKEGRSRQADMDRYFKANSYPSHPV